jgi:hypothetical protein
MVDEKINSVLIGNGLDIQVGGDDYLNKWIIVRLLAKAKMGKYDVLFMDSQDATPSLTGDEIVALFNGMVDIANNARENKYSYLVKTYGDKDVIDALEDFKARYTHKITNIEEIGMEDWILMLLLLLIEQGDILEHYEAAKQGFERIVFDSIYCEGNIQRLHSKMGKSAKSYFSNFDNIFTLNYDNTLEKLNNHPVFHLHGDFCTKSISENPNTAHGYLRKQNGQSIWFPPQFEHCNCNAILDFSGNRKYNLATNMTKAFTEFQKFKKEISGVKDGIKHTLEKFPAEQRKVIQIGVEKNLECGHDYHFQHFEQLTGILTIIGLAPQNDNHIFSCINKSNIEKVVFYHYFGEKSDDEVDEEIKSITLSINKPYIIENIKKLWDKIKITKPNNSTTYNQILLNKSRNKFLNIFNSIYVDAAVSEKDILWQLKSIPVATERAIYEMMAYEISKSKYHTTPQSEEELFKYFFDFGKTLKTASINPQALYFIYIIWSQSNSKKSQNKSTKRRQKR